MVSELASYSRVQLELILITYNRPQLVIKALNSFLTSLNKVNFSVNFSWRIQILINGKDDSSSIALKEWMKNHNSSQVQIHESNQLRTPAAARNFLIKRANADWVYFADDDVWVPEDFFKRFGDQYLSNSEVHVVGGPNWTGPDEPWFAKISGRWLEDPWIVGPMAKRYQRNSCGVEKGDQLNLILCNLFARREALFDQTFPENFICGEENYWIQQVEAKKMNLLFDSGLGLFHLRRSKVKTFFQQIFKYGVGRGENISRGNGFNLPTFLLLVFLFSLVICFSIPGGWVLVLIYFVYFFGLSMVRQDLGIIVGGPLLQLFYFLGIISGLFRGGLLQVQKIYRFRV